MNWNLHKMQKMQDTRHCFSNQMISIGTQEILLIVLVVLLFFGGKKIPELMKGLGKGVRSFKDGMSNIEKEVNVSEDVSVDTEKRNNNG